MANPDREQEKKLLDQWFSRISFDKKLKGVPAVKPEPGDDE